MESICNDERASFGVMSGHDRKTLSLSHAGVRFLATEAEQVLRQTANLHLVGSFGDAVTVPCLHVFPFQRLDLTLDEGIELGQLGGDLWGRVKSMACLL